MLLMILSSTQSLTYKDLIKELHRFECTHRQYAALIAAPSNPETANCGTRMDFSPPAFLEGTSEFYLRRTAILSHNCLLMCTPKRRKSFHAESGVIANHKLIQGLRTNTRNKLWLLTFLEPCDYSFLRSNGERVSSCAGKIVRFCQAFPGKVHILYRDIHERNSGARVGEQQMTRVCASYGQRDSLQSRIEGRTAVHCVRSRHGGWTSSHRTKRHALITYNDTSLSCTRVTGKQVEVLENETSKGDPKFVGNTIMLLDSNKVYTWHNRTQRYKLMGSGKSIKMIRQIQRAEEQEGTSLSHSAKGSMNGDVTDDVSKQHLENLLQEHAATFGGQMRTLPNVGYIFTGYNLDDGNPFTREGIDPGICLADIFKSTYSGRTTVDKLTFLPDGIHGRNSISCQRHATSHVFQTAEQYAEFFNAQVGIQVRLHTVAVIFNYLIMLMLVKT